MGDSCFEEGNLKLTIVGGLIIDLTRIFSMRKRIELLFERGMFNISENWLI